MTKTIETRIIGFSAASHNGSFWRTWADNMVAKNPGLTRTEYCCNNGGVTIELEFTGPTWLLDRIERKYGYGY